MSEALGVSLIITGKQYEVNPLSEHPRSCFIGELLTKLSDITEDALLDIIRKNPSNPFAIENDYRNLYETCSWLKDQLNPTYDPIAADLIYSQFIKEVKAFKEPGQKYFNSVFFSLLDNGPLKKRIFSGSGYESFGCTNIGHFLYSVSVSVCFYMHLNNHYLSVLTEQSRQSAEHLVTTLFDPNVASSMDIRYRIIPHKGTLRSFYTIQDIGSLLVFEVAQIIEQGITVRACQNCGKFFITQTRSDTLYCLRPSPQDKTLTCKEYGSKKLWYDRVMEDELSKLSRNVYTAKQMLVRRNPDISEYREMFDYFKEERMKWTAAVKSGDKSPEEFKDWLNTIKKRKAL